MSGSRTSLEILQVMQEVLRQCLVLIRPWTCVLGLKLAWDESKELGLRAPKPVAILKLASYSKTKTGKVCRSLLF